MKQQRPIVLQVTEPCQEAWTDMTPAAGGKFCDHCQKKVVDFSAMTDRQLLEFFSSHSGPVCGRLRADQVNRELQEKLPGRSGVVVPLYRLAAGLTLLFGFATDVQAQKLKSPTIKGDVVQQEPRLELPEPVLQQDAVKTNISGIITDDNKKPVRNASVRLYASVSGQLLAEVYTDENGNYRIQKYLAYPSGTPLRLEFAHFGAEISRNISLQEEPLVVDGTLQVLKMPEHILGGIRSYTPPLKPVKR